MKERIEVPYCSGREVPVFDLPKNACDTHFHIFNPVHFPYKQEDVRNQPPATVDCYQMLMRHMGIERCVIVNPSCYGVDNSCTISALRQFGDCARAIVVIDKDTPMKLLKKWDEYGVKGIRFNLVSGSMEQMEQAMSLSKKVAKLGWHTQFFMSPDITVKMEKELQSYPTAVVLDHMGHLPADVGIRHEAYEIMLSLIRAKKAYVKLSGFYINSRQKDLGDMLEIGQSFMKDAPEGLLWGTDWPHHHCWYRHEPMPDDAYMLDGIMQGCDSEGIKEQIFVKNPELLYGFKPAGNL